MKRGRGEDKSEREEENMIMIVTVTVWNNSSIYVSDNDSKSNHMKSDT